VCLLLALLAAVFLVSLPSASAQAGCFSCVVSSCAAFNNGTAPDISIGSLSAAAAAAECTTLNTDIGGFISTAQNATCAANVAQLACEVIATVNQTDTACNTSTIGVGTPFGNQTYFQQRCASAVGCLGYTFQDEVAAGHACSSFPAFLGALIAQPVPSTLACAPCNITSCYGLSSIGVTDVTFWTGSLPGLNGSACAAQQAVAASLLASGNAGVPDSIVQQTVCNSLAAMTLVDSQAACNAGQVDSIFDGVVFSSSSAHNLTWESYCQPVISQVFNATVVSRLIAADYCVSPSAGLTNYAAQYLLPAPGTSGSSNSSVPSARGCYPCVVSSCAGYFNGTAPMVSVGSASAAAAAAECTTINTDIGGFITTAQNATCASNVAQLACEVIATVNQTDTACNTSTIGVGTPFGNQSYFEERCESATSCLSYFFQDEVAAAQACTSFPAFVSIFVSQPAPSTVPCAPCNITACYGLSTVGVTDVTFWAGSLPGYNGSACAAQQLVAATLLASGADGVPASAVQQAVCNPQAALTLIDSQAACNAGQLDSLLDAALFTAAAQQNITWETYCQASIPQLFNPTLASRLIAAGYCLSPSIGLTNYALQYLVAAPNGTTPASVSSSSSAATVSVSSSSSAAFTASSSSTAAGAAVASSSSSGSSAAAATSTSPAAASSSTSTVLVTPTSSTASPVQTASGGSSSSSAISLTFVPPTSPPVSNPPSSTAPSGPILTGGAGSVHPSVIAAAVAAVAAVGALLLL